MEIFAAAKTKEINRFGKFAIKEDLEKRFQKAMVDELELNPPLLVPYILAGQNAKELERKVNELYTSDNLQDDCSQIKIKITIEVEVHNER